MSKIAFFCIPAYGHTNPTLEVVRKLVKRGNEIRYYSYDTFGEMIKATGAHYISCDKYDIQMNLTKEDSDRMVRDISFSIEVMVNTTLAMDEAIIEELKMWEPDCIVADSMAIWGKLAALKLNIPFVSSTTTFAFNRYSARLMKQGFGESMKSLLSMMKANKHIKKLRDKGYPVKGVLSVIQNDNDTNTIVYTSPEFQPYAGTFSDKYTFVGPSIRALDYEVVRQDKRTVYISMGTVNTKQIQFYRNCIDAFRESDTDVIISVGDRIEIEDLGDIPSNIQIQKSVNQIEVLQKTDIFITHCGMNSVNEALYYEVPLLMFPQTTEQGAVAHRVHELGAGIYLQDDSVDAIKKEVEEVSCNPAYRESAKKIAEGFRKCGGPRLAADKILESAQ